MNITDIVTGGFIGSVITLIIKSIFDVCSSHIAYKRELRKQVFQRKTDVVERAMSWYQEAVDMYNLFQMAISGYDGTTNPVTVEKIQYASTQLNKLLPETSAASISRLIKAAVEEGLIKLLDSKASPKYRKYVPWWA